MQLQTAHQRSQLMHQVTALNLHLARRGRAYCCPRPHQLAVGCTESCLQELCGRFQALMDDNEYLMSQLRDGETMKAVDPHRVGDPRSLLGRDLAQLPGQPYSSHGFIRSGVETAHGTEQAGTRLQAASQRMFLDPVWAPPSAATPYTSSLATWSNAENAAPKVPALCLSSGRAGPNCMRLVLVFMQFLIMLVLAHALAFQGATPLTVRCPQKCHSDQTCGSRSTQDMYKSLIRACEEATRRTTFLICKQSSRYAGATHQDCGDPMRLSSCASATTSDRNACSRSWTMRRVLQNVRRQRQTFSKKSAKSCGR